MDHKDYEAVHRLRQRLPKLDFPSVPLELVVQFLREISGISIYVDWKELHLVSVDKTTEINLHLVDASLARTFRLLCRDASYSISPLACFLDEGVVILTTAEAAANRDELRSAALVIDSGGGQMQTDDRPGGPVLDMSVRDASDDNTIAVLLISATPLGELPVRVGEEFRAIAAHIRASEHANRINIVPCPSARTRDLMQAFNQHRPGIVHFSGHGDADGKVVFIDDEGEPVPVPQAGLIGLFKCFDCVRVVVLNCCNSAALAADIANVVGCAVGMSDEIPDSSAIAFAQAFYGALGFGLSVNEAFEQGKAAIGLEDIAAHNVPQLFLCDGRIGEMALISS